jgi:hypothetical protein
MPQDDFSQYKRKQSDDEFAQFKRSGAVPGEEGFEAAQTPYGPTPPQDTVIGGALRRGKNTIEGIYQTVAAPPTEEERKEFPTAFERPALIEHRVAKGVVEGEKEAGRQTAGQFKQALQARDPVNTPLGIARSGVTALSMLDPFATGSVTNVNKLEDQGRNREAIGQGAFDVLTMLAGGKTGRGPSEAKSLNRVAYATGAEDVGALTKIMPELRETIAQTGKPNTVQDLAGAIQKTSERLDQKFNAGLTQVAADKIVPDQIADALESKANSLPRTASDEAQALRAEAKSYRQTWTIRELNAERMYRNGLARGFEQKGAVAQMGAMRSNAQSMIDKLAADTARDVLYDYMEKKIPGGNWRELKQKQAAILGMTDHMAEHIQKLESGSAQKAGAPMRSKMGVSAVVTPTRGPHPFLHFPMTGTPQGWANTASRTAFGPTSAATTRRAAILAMPLSQFVTQPDIPKTPGEARDRARQLAPQ